MVAWPVRRPPGGELKYTTCSTCPRSTAFKCVKGVFSGVGADTFKLIFGRPRGRDNGRSGRVSTPEVAQPKDRATRAAIMSGFGVASPAARYLENCIDW